MSASAALAVPSGDVAALTQAQVAMQGVADQAKALIKEIDHLAKLTQKAQEAMVSAGQALVEQQISEAAAKKVQVEVRKQAAEGKKLVAAIADARVPLTGDADVQLSVTGALKRARYFEGQAEWLLSRFPEGR